MPLDMVMLNVPCNKHKYKWNFSEFETSGKDIKSFFFFFFFLYIYIYSFRILRNRLPAWSLWYVNINNSISIHSKRPWTIYLVCWWGTFEPRHDKTNKVTARPAKTQISLGIRPVWSESSLSAWRKLGSLATHWAHREDSDQTGRMPRLIWVFESSLGAQSLCWFYHFQVHFAHVSLYLRAIFFFFFFFFAK